jgi:2-keto-4-pentenoate hydratase/2-oxohepta-3-ene-1,7-dioic acid hydratase in catechol pathway
LKLLRYGPKGAERPGVIDSSGTLRDLSCLVKDVGGETLLPQTLARLREADLSSLPNVPRGTRLGPCVAAVGKIVCVGLNYSDHAAESNMAIPTEPILFMKATSSIIGPNDEVEIPPGSQKTDWEVELGVVIGKPARYVPLERAMEHVAGYCVVNDVSERAYQLERGGQWDRGRAAIRLRRLDRGWSQRMRFRIRTASICGSRSMGGGTRMGIRAR